MRVRQSFRNDEDRPIYVAIEPWPECFELLPKEELTVHWDIEPGGLVGTVTTPAEGEIWFTPEADVDGITFFIDGKRAEDRSWNFHHRKA